MIWETIYDNPGDSLVESISDLLVKDDHILISGFAQNQSGDSEFLVLKIDSDGNIISEIKRNKNPDYFDEGYAIKEDFEGNIYLTARGHFEGDEEYENLDVLKFSPIISGTKNKNQPPEIEVYPNPFSENLTVKGAFEKLIITDLFGKTVFEKEVFESNLQINLSHLNNGIYIISCQKQNGIFSKKILKH